MNIVVLNSLRHISEPIKLLRSWSFGALIGCVHLHRKMAFRLAVGMEASRRQTNKLRPSRGLSPRALGHVGVLGQLSVPISGYLWL